MKLIRSFTYAWNGIRSTFVSEQNFRIHLMVTFVVLILSIVLKISTKEWMAVGFCIAFVMVTEMLNTAIEKLCDVVQQDIHPGIKKVKDIAAGAVLVSAIFSSVTGLIIFLPKMIMYFKSV